jgi:hypothetical protein
MWMGSKSSASMPLTGFDAARLRAAAVDWRVVDAMVVLLDAGKVGVSTGYDVWSTMWKGVMTLDT